MVAWAWHGPWGQTEGSASPGLLVLGLGKTSVISFAAYPVSPTCWGHSEFTGPQNKAEVPVLVGVRAYPHPSPLDHQEVWENLPTHQHGPTPPALITASLAEGPAAAPAVPAAGGGRARGLRLPPPPPPGPPLRDPGSQEAPPVRGHLQPQPAGGGRSPAGDGQCPQGAAGGETHLGLPGCRLQHSGAPRRFPPEAPRRPCPVAGLLPQQRGPGHLVAKRPLRRQPLPLPRCGQERGALREADGGGGVAWQGRGLPAGPAGSCLRKPSAVQGGTWGHPLCVRECM